MLMSVPGMFLAPGCFLFELPPLPSSGTAPVSAEPRVERAFFLDSPDPLGSADFSAKKIAPHSVPTTKQITGMNAVFIELFFCCTDHDFQNEVDSCLHGQSLADRGGVG